jgi:TolB-like protein/DNA-binding winged helix-turn-helix (wHTH) protein/Tfp pilus assembly protein PilF
MASSGQPRSVIRFGTFEVDLRAGELYKQGRKIKLQQQPFQVLVLLLQRAGDVVNREELKQTIWPADTFVDFDIGLAGAIYKLRQALGDTAESPRYVETLPRRGYRFLAPVVSSPTQLARDGDGTAAEPAANSKLVAIDVRLPVRESPEKPAEISSQSAGTAPRSTASWLRKAVIVSGLIAVGAVAWWFAHPKPNSKIIAVLPFKNLSPEPNSDYFSDGLTDEIISNLSVIDGLEVKSRTSSFEFKDKPRNIRKVGEQLGASLVLEGSVLRSGDKLRINAQLVRVGDDTPLWSGHFDRELKDIFAVQDEISRGIVNQLRLKLGAGQRRYNANLEAYELYLKAEHSLDEAAPGGKQDPAKAIALYEQVLVKDGDFAPAYAGLAAAYARLSNSNVNMPAIEANARMHAAAEAALRLDPLLPQAHNLMGMVYARERAWGDAEQSFRRAIQLNPNLSMARIQFAMWVLFPLGKQEEALVQMRKAVELDPLSEFVTVDAAYIMNNTGRHDDALAYSRRLVATYPDNGFLKVQVGRALTDRGQVEEAIKIYEELRFPHANHYLGYAYAKAGRRAEAEAIAARNQEFPHRLAVIYAGLGDKDRTFDALNKMDKDKNPLLESYISFPELALIRGDPRLAELRRRLGLPAIP